MRRIAVGLCIALVSLAVAAQPNEPAALARLGQEASARGDADKAVEYFEKASALKPNDAVLHYQLGNAYGAAAQSGGMFGGMSLAKKAKAEWERAIELDPNNVEARYSLMQFLTEAPSMIGGSESGAMEQAAEIKKRDAINGHRAFAFIYAAGKKTDQARKEVVDMVKEQPASARAHYFFGVYLMTTDKNYKSAGDEFESVLKLDPSYVLAYFQIGHVAALAANNFPRGEESLKKYLAYKPKDGEPSIARTHYWLGTLYEKQGKKAEAKASYATALKINPSQKDAQEAMKRVG
jgi:tetratricopeptide (TPR) repeat protein